MARKHSRDGHVLVEIHPEEIKDVAAHAAGILQDAGEAAVKTVQKRAHKAADWAENLKPHVEKAWSESVLAAGSKVEHLAKKAGPSLTDATEKLVPAVEQAGVKAGEGITAAHGKLVEEFLPRIVQLLSEANEKRGKEDVAEDVVKVAKKVKNIKPEHHVAVVAAEAVAEPVKEHHHKRKLVMLLALAGGVAAYHYWRQANPPHDPWAEPFEESEKPEYHQVAGDAAEKIGAAAGTAVAYGRDAAGKIGEFARDSFEKIKANIPIGVVSDDDDDLIAVRDTFLDGSIGHPVVVKERKKFTEAVDRIVSEARDHVGDDHDRLVTEARTRAEAEAPTFVETFRAKHEGDAKRLAEEAKEKLGEAKDKAEAEAKKLLAEAKTKGEAEGRKLVAEVTTKAEAETRKLIAKRKADGVSVSDVARAAKRAEPETVIENIAVIRVEDIKPA